jgi:hypothetical protein
MEAMMKDICEGRRTKNDVVLETVAMYREVFMKANREVNVLVQVRLLFLNAHTRRASDTFRRKIIEAQREVFA